MNKGSFRRLCKECGVSTPATYFIGSEADFARETFDWDDGAFPLIVKPVDQGANVGISVCRESGGLVPALHRAWSESDSGEAIVEQFVEGDEVSMTYVIQEGQCRLVCMGTKISYTDQNGLSALSHAYVYPSPALPAFLASEDEVVRGMIAEAGLDNCTIFFQGIHSSGKFYLFEAGLRMEGTATYRMTEAMSGQNFMHFLIDSWAGITPDYDLTYEDPTFGGRKCVYFSQIAKAGTVGAITGIDGFSDNPLILSVEQRKRPGDVVEEDGTLRQIAIRWVIFADQIGDAVALIKRIQSEVDILDVSGRSMLVSDFDPSCLIET